MRIVAILLFLTVAIMASAITIRVGFEGPALLGATLETDSGLFFTIGASPPMSIFGGGGEWSYSFAGGYASAFTLLDTFRSELKLVTRIAAALVLTDTTYLGVIPGVLTEVTWKIASFRLGVQAGISLCLLFDIEDFEPDLVPTGQIGILARF